MSTPDFSMIDWTDAKLDAAFRRAKAQPLEGFLNSGEHHVDVDAHVIYNDQRWKGFMPVGLPATEATARLSLGFAKKLWKRGQGYGGETQYFGGRIKTPHTVDEITVNQRTGDIPRGSYTLLGYTDPVFRDLFYDLVKPVSHDLMLFRGVTGQFPGGRRGWTALLLRRYPFAQMGIDDHEVLLRQGKRPTTDAMLGEWRLDALYHSNRPVPVTRMTVERRTGRSPQLHCDTSISRPGLILPKFVSDHFQSERWSALQREMRAVDGRYVVGKWTTRLSGLYPKLLLTGSAGLFHREPGRQQRFSLFYLLTRLA